MIAHIIPYQKTPAGTDFFTYAIPETLTVTVGDIVWIPLRSKKVCGLVWKIEKENTQKKLKYIHSISSYDYWKNQKRRALLLWFARYYGVSMATAFKTMQWNLVERPQKKEIAIKKKKKESQNITPLLIKKESLILFNQESSKYEIYNRIIAGAKKHVLIIAPEYTHVKKIHKAITYENTVPCTLESSSFFHALIETVSESTEKYVVIGTKKTSFLPIDWEIIIVDQEESKSHKQYNANPRYHVRSVVQQLPAVKIYTSIAPSMHSAKSLEEKKLALLDMRDVWNNDRVTMIDMKEEYSKKNYTWFSELLQKRIEAAKKTFLFLNRVGTYKIGVCSDCATMVPLDTGVCPNCGSSQIRLQGKGTETIEKEIHTLFPKKNILRIDRTVDIKEITVKKRDDADIIIGTEKALSLIDFSRIDCIGILSADHLLLYPHFQSHERVWQVLSSFACMGPATIIQTYSPEHPVLQAVARNTVEEYMEKELGVRKLFALPPYAPYIRYIDTKTNQITLSQEELDDERLKANVIVDRNE